MKLFNAKKTIECYNGINMAWLNKNRQDEIDSKIDSILQGIGAEYPDDSLIDIAKKLNIKVYLSDFEEFSDEISGVIKYPDGEQPKIFLNSNQSKVRRTFTLAHELGHYFLHKDSEQKYRVDRFNYSEGTTESKEETEANYFAASLLVPVDKLKKLIKETDNLDAIADYFGVSTATIRNRLRWLKNN